jgi:hypothetical protein
MSTNEPGQRLSTRETQVSPPKPGIHATDPAGSTPNTKDPRPPFAICTNWLPVPQETRRAPQAHLLDPVFTSSSPALCWSPHLDDDILSTVSPQLREPAREALRGRFYLFRLIGLSRRTLASRAESKLFTSHDETRCSRPKGLCVKDERRGHRFRSHAVLRKGPLVTTS